MRGAHLGKKSRIGMRCVVQRPWCLTTGTRCQLEHDVFMKITHDTARIAMGEEVFVGRGVEFDVSFDLTIGSDVLFGPGCFITDHEHLHALGQSVASQGCVDRSVNIGNDVWLGANVVVLAGVSIGCGAIVGAGAVVNKDVPPMSIYAGVPARQIGSRVR